MTAILGLAACARGGAPSTSAGAVDPARAAFLATPDSVPAVVREIAAEFPDHPPTPGCTALLVAAARTGFSASAFNAAFAAAPPAGRPPDGATRAALAALGRAEARPGLGAAGGSAGDQAGPAADALPMRPALAEAEEEGLALDRINLLVEATRNDPDVVRALAPSVAASRGADILAYSRDNVAQEDATWGGHRQAALARARAQEAAALRTLAPADLALAARWYAGPGGRGEAARYASALARAYDAAAAAMTKDYYRRLLSAPTAGGGAG